MGAKEKEMARKVRPCACVDKRRASSSGASVTSNWICSIPAMPLGRYATQQPTWHVPYGRTARTPPARQIKAHGMNSNIGKLSTSNLSGSPRRRRTWTSRTLGACRNRTTTRSHLFRTLRGRRPGRAVRTDLPHPTRTSGRRLGGGCGGIRKQ